MKWLILSSVPLEPSSYSSDNIPKTTNMKVFIVFAALCLVLASARPQDSAAYTVAEEFDNIGVDGYKFSYETSNGIKRQEEATVNNLGTDYESIAIRGQYSFVADDGQTYTVDFVADEGGFQPTGAHLPAAQ